MIWYLYFKTPLVIKQLFKNALKITFLLFFAGLFFLSSNGCDFGRNENCSSTVGIDLPLTIFPAQDTFAVGDTIWINSLVPGEITDTKSGAIYKGEDYFAPLSFAIEEEFVKAMQHCFMNYADTQMLIAKWSQVLQMRMKKKLQKT